MGFNERSEDKSHSSGYALHLAVLHDEKEEVPKKFAFHQDFRDRE